MARQAATRAVGDATANSNGNGSGRESHLSDFAYEAVLGAIARCELPPGAWLNEREASAELGMSRTPFRQALHRLTLDGLIQSVPRRGARVTLLDMKDIADNLEVREALEVAALRRILHDKLPVDLDRLSELISVMKRAIADDDAPSFLEADEQFHLTIAAAAGNRRTIEALKRAWVHINRARYLEPPDRSVMRSSVQEHTKILASLRGGKLREVERTVVSHMTSAGDLFGDLRQRMPEAFRPEGD